MINFEGQVALVTGSGRGLGAAYARLLARLGASVVVHDAGVSQDGNGFDPEVANSVVNEINSDGGIAIASYEKLDSRPACQKVINTAIQHFGRLDIFVHNAGLLKFMPIEEVDPALFQRILEVSTVAPFWLSQAAFPHMKAQNYGRIVFTTSGRGMYLEAAMPGLTSYAFGKMAQLGLMNALAAEAAHFDIKVNAISPVAATRMLQTSVGPNEYRPEQIAPGVAFLASRQCDFSGVILRAGNGQYSTAHWSFSESITLLDDLTPEALARHWDEIKS